MEQRWVVLKVLLTVLVVLMMAGTLLEQKTELPYLVGLPDLEFKHGVKAALFAMAAATLLFIATLPSQSREGPLTLAQTTDGLLHVVIALATFLAGSFWLLEETNGKPAPYLLTVLVLAAVTAIAITPYLAAVFLQTKRHRN